MTKSLFHLKIPVILETKLGREATASCLDGVCWSLLREYQEVGQCSEVMSVIGRRKRHPCGGCGAVVFTPEWSTREDKLGKGEQM